MVYFNDAQRLSWLNIYENRLKLNEYKLSNIRETIDNLMFKDPEVMNYIGIKEAVYIVLITQSKMQDNELLPLSNPSEEYTKLNRIYKYLNSQFCYYLNNTRFPRHNCLGPGCAGCDEEEEILASVR
jgi:hypothetical protein